MFITIYLEAPCVACTADFLIGLEKEKNHQQCRKRTLGPKLANVPPPKKNKTKKKKIIWGALSADGLEE